MTPILYRIRDWSKHYENSQSRKLSRLTWIPVPIKLNGTGFGLLMEMPNGPAIFGCFIALVEVVGESPRASADSPTTVGKSPTTVADSPGRDGGLRRSDGRPHTSATLSIRTRIPRDLIQETLETLSSGEIDWLERIEMADSTTVVADSPTAVADSADVVAESPRRIEGNGKARQGSEGNGIELKGREGKGKAGAGDSLKPESSGSPLVTPPPDPIQEIANALHEATGKPPDLALGERLCRETALEGIHPHLTRRWIEHKALERKRGGNPIRLPKLFLDDWLSELPVWIKANLSALNGGRYGLMESPPCGKCRIQQFLFEDGCIVRCKCVPKPLALVRAKAQVR